MQIMEMTSLQIEQTAEIAFIIAEFFASSGSVT